MPAVQGAHGKPCPRPICSCSWLPQAAQHALMVPCIAHFLRACAGLLPGQLALRHDATGDAVDMSFGRVRGLQVLVSGSTSLWLKLAGCCPSIQRSGVFAAARARPTAERSLAHTSRSALWTRAYVPAAREREPIGCPDPCTQLHRAILKVQPS